MGFAGSFPGEFVVGDEVSGEPELGVGGCDGPGPPVGLFGGADRGGDPAQSVLREPEGVLDVEAVQVGAGTKVEVGSSGSGPPEPQGLFGSAGRFGEVFDVDADDGVGCPEDGERLMVGPVAAAVEAGVELRAAQGSATPKRVAVLH